MLVIDCHYIAASLGMACCQRLQVIYSRICDSEVCDIVASIIALLQSLSHHWAYYVAQTGMFLVAQRCLMCAG